LLLAGIIKNVNSCALDICWLRDKEKPILPNLAGRYLNRIKEHLQQFAGTPAEIKTT